MSRHSNTSNNQLERNLQIGVIEQPASLLIFVMQALTNGEAPSGAQIDAARSAAKSVIELCGATVYAVSDALKVDNAGGVAQVLLKYEEVPSESEGEIEGGNNNNDNGGEA